MNNFKWSDRDEYPFESHRFPVPADNLHYIDEGSGPPFYLLY